jgi:hypothetical protein
MTLASFVDFNVFIEREIIRMGLRKSVLFRNLAFCFIIVAVMLLLNIKSAAAFSVSDYFTLSYHITLSASNVTEGQTFNATVSGTGTCKAKLPISVSAATIESSIVATNQATGTEVTLCPSYTLTIKPFPNEVGQTAQVNQTIPLTFPAGSTAGSYTVTGELIAAKVDAIIWIDVSGYFPSSQTIGTVNYDLNSSNSTGGGSGGGGSSTTTTTTTTTTTPPPVTTTSSTTTTTLTTTTPPLVTTTSTTTTTTTPTTPSVADSGIVNTSLVINVQGIFTEMITDTSADGLTNLTINPGTVGLTANGTPLQQISITSVTSPPPPPSGADVIGLAYDFEPAGTTFNPPISMKFSYNPTNIPSGVSETSLVVVYYSVSTGQWVTVPSVVDPVNHTITAQVSHFTVFSVMYIPPSITTPTTTPAPVLSGQVTTTPTPTSSITSGTLTPTPTTTKTSTGLSIGWIIAIAVIGAIVVVTIVLAVIMGTRRKK